MPTRCIILALRSDKGHSLAIFLKSVVWVCITKHSLIMILSLGDNAYNMNKNMVRKKKKFGKFTHF